jgi:MFS family permease
VREVWQLFVQERRARIFFVAMAQSSLGTGAAYVALLLIAYDRWHSPWSITLILLADLAPAMFFGPMFGAAADRWSRRGCAILADLVRFGAFVGIALAGTFEATLAFALVAGCGTALFTPATLAALPGLVEAKRLPAATSVYGAMTDVGFTGGPSLAALVLLFTSAETLLFANGVTFAVSAALLAGISFGPSSIHARERGKSLLREARDGLAATAGMPAIRHVILGSAAALFFAGAFNVAELPFADDVLDSGEVGYSLLAAVFGLGLLLGSLLGASGGPVNLLKARYLMGLVVLGIGLVASGLAPVLPVAMAAFCLAGFGNGAMIVYERLLIQATVADRLAGRVFGVKDALTAWAFGGAFIAAGGLVELFGIRESIVGFGVGCIGVWVVMALSLRRSFSEAGAEAPSSGVDALGNRVAG